MVVVRSLYELGFRICRLSSLDFKVPILSDLKWRVLGSLLTEFYDRLVQTSRAFEASRELILRLGVG